LIVGIFCHETKNESSVAWIVQVNINVLRPDCLNK
jgi:hypothetical protein